MLSLRSRSHQLLAAIVFLGLCLVLYQYHDAPVSFYHDKVQSHSTGVRGCPQLPGAEDVLFILKTGGTESQALLPAHLNTYLPCIPNYTIYSDIAEVIDGHQIHDALEGLDEDIRLHEPDFDLYRQQIELQGNGVPLETLRDPPQMKKEDKKAWKLDKWKFLPLVDKAIETHPTASWYFFLEADTYINISNLFQYLTTVNSYETWYIGAQNNFGEKEFGHGGAGYLLSGSAARMISKQVNANKERYTELVRKECCGDLILSMVFKDMGVDLTKGWPLFQGETPTSLDYQARNWCRPAISYHHMAPDDIIDYWNFETAWRKSSRLDQPIMHRDAFEHYVEQKIQAPIAFWDNKSGERVLELANSDEASSDVDKLAHTSFKACEAACMADSQCVQLSYKTGECRLGYRPTLGGNTSESIESAWIKSRIDDFRASQEPCTPQWTGS